MLCHGNGPDHCCYVNGEVCIFLEEHSEPGRRWSCGLRRTLGSWDAVHTDPRYLASVKPAWEATGTQDCGDFGPVESQCCFGHWVDPERPTVRNESVVGLGMPARPKLGRRV